MCALALTAVVASVMLRELGWRGVGVFGVCVAVVAVGRILPHVFEVSEAFSFFSRDLGVSETATTVMKIVGTGYLAGIVSDVCRDMGEAGIASAVTTVGRVEMLAIAAPSFFEVIRLGVELIQ